MRASQLYGLTIIRHVNALAGLSRISTALNVQYCQGLQNLDGLANVTSLCVLRAAL